MFAIIPVIWVPITLVGVVRGKFVLSRSLPLFIIAILGLAYLFAFRRSSALHQILGIVANLAFVLGIGLSSARSSSDESSWAVAAAGIAILLVFVYPLVLLIGQTTSRVKDESRRA
jgi:hypothetical protein